MNVFSIKSVKKKIEPYYDVTIKTDENDGDYQTKHLHLTPENFEKMQYYYYLLSCSDLSKYGRLRELEYSHYFESGVPFGSDGEPCHTLEYIEIKYYDENNLQHEVHFNESLENDLYAIYKIDDIPSSWINLFSKYINEDNKTVHPFKEINWEEHIKSFK